MTAAALTRERVVLDRLKETYERQGYEFFVNPPLDILPNFLGGLRPDAIAMKPDESIIIEVKRGRRVGNDSRLETIANFVSGQRGWKFKVFFEGEQPEIAIRIFPSTHAQIEQQMAEADRLVAAGHDKAALLLAWSILEAIVRAWVAGEGALSDRPFSPAEAVQSLEMSGLLDREAARDLQAKAQLRNLVAHGDLSVEIQHGVVEELILELRRLVAATIAK